MATLEMLLKLKGADWLHKARSMPHQQFKKEVHKYLSGDSESSELIYFKLCMRQVPVIEQALEITARMLGADISRGYCLEMICADFLAGANLEPRRTTDVSTAILRLPSSIAAARIPTGGPTASMSR